MPTPGQASQTIANRNVSPQPIKHARPTADNNPAIALCWRCQSRVNQAAERADAHDGNCPGQLGQERTRSAAARCTRQNTSKATRSSTPSKIAISTTDAATPSMSGTLLSLTAPGQAGWPPVRNAGAGDGKQNPHDQRGRSDNGPRSPAVRASRVACPTPSPQPPRPTTSARPSMRSPHQLTCANVSQAGCRSSKSSTPAGQPIRR